MRLIDADEFKAFNARWMANEKDPDKKRARETRTQLFNTFIDMQETVDAVPVVRCKDCKWYKEEKGKIGSGCCACLKQSGKGEFICWDNWYCAEGERKDEQTL